MRLKVKLKHELFGFGTGHHDTCQGLRQWQLCFSSSLPFMRTLYHSLSSLNLVIAICSVILGSSGDATDRRVHLY